MCLAFGDILPVGDLKKPGTAKEVTFLVLAGIFRLNVWLKRKKALYDKVLVNLWF